MHFLLSFSLAPNIECIFVSIMIPVDFWYWLSWTIYDFGLSEQRLFRVVLFYSYPLFMSLSLFIFYVHVARVSSLLTGLSFEKEEEQSNRTFILYSLISVDCVPFFTFCATMKRWNFFFICSFFFFAICQSIMCVYGQKKYVLLPFQSISWRS